MDGNAIFGLPQRNTQRVPLANHPAPHVLRMLSPERMYRKSENISLGRFHDFFNRPGKLKCKTALNVCFSKLVVGVDLHQKYEKRFFKIF